MMEKSFSFNRNGSSSTLTIFKVRNEVNVTIRATVTDGWYYEGAKIIPTETHSDVRTMKIEINEKNLKIIQHTKTSAHKSTCSMAIPDCIIGRKEIVDSRMVYLEPLNDEDADTVVLKWVKAFIEYNYHIISSDQLSVDGATLETINIYKQQRVRPD